MRLFDTLDQLLAEIRARSSFILGTNHKLPKLIIVGRDEMELIEAGAPDWANELAHIYGYAIDGVRVKVADRDSFLDVV